MNAIDQKDAQTLEEVFLLQKEYSLVLRKEPVERRKERLIKLQGWIHSNRSEIHAAMYKDFQKAAQEVDAIEIFHVLNEIRFAISNLESWSTPKKVDAPITLMGTRSWIQYEPKGVCLIISPWNYPFSLAVGPLVSALSAGNAVILKPSEMTPHVSRLLRRMAENLYAKNEVSVMEGGADVATKLLELPFDHIFFTGSPAVGKVVMRAAAEHLTSITLELGGKSPAIVTADANIDEAAERIAIGKFVNNGQTCIAPDYILVDQKVEKKLIDAITAKTKNRFGGNGSFETSPSYCRIVNDSHFNRLSFLLEDAVSKGARVNWDGEHNKSTRFFHPVILSDVPSNASVLEEEVFGPILPIISYHQLQEAVDYVNRKPKPLALYVFSSTISSHEKVISSTSAGGVCINDCGIHFFHHKLPFGGINHSGMGRSHGHFGFLAFSNEKSVLKQRNGITTLKAFYPPYTRATGKLMDWFLKFF